MIKDNQTDKDGNPVDHDSFAYEIDGEGDIILNESESYENSMDITNSKNTTPEPTVTNTPVPSGQPTVTPSERTSTPVPGGSTSTNNDGGGTTGRTSVKTGDNTPIGVWVGILAAAIVVGGAAGFAVKRKKKKKKK